MERVIRVLVVDDSAYVRKTIKQILSRNPSFEVVGTARGGDEGLDLVRELRPDVVTADLIMPDMDGAEFTRRVMETQPVPVVIVSIASESSERVLAALDAGAIDFVQKPTALATEKVSCTARLGTGSPSKSSSAVSVNRNRAPSASSTPIS